MLKSVVPTCGVVRRSRPACWRRSRRRRGRAGRSGRRCSSCGRRRRATGPSPVELHDQADLGCRRRPAKLALGPGRPPGRLPPARPFGEVMPSSPAQAAAPEAVADRAFSHGRRLVAGVEDAGVDGVAVRAHRERARRVAEERHDAERRAAEASRRGRRVEHPDVGAIHAGRDELRVAGPGDAGDAGVGALLAAVGGGDEGALARVPGEDDVARLVADQQRARHARAAGHAHVDDAHAVGEVVDDPDLGRACAPRPRPAPCPRRPRSRAGSTLRCR